MQDNTKQGQEQNAPKAADLSAEELEIRADAWHAENAQPAWMEDGDPYGGCGGDW